MFERQEPGNNFDDGLTRIHNLVQEGKAFSFHLAGPEGDGIIECGDFATIIFDHEGGGLVMRPVSARGSQAEDICRMILDLGSPDNFIEDEIAVGEDIEKSLRFECFTRDVPLAVIGFGKTEDSKIDAAVLYVVAGIPPKEMHKKMWEEANREINGHNDDTLPPDTILS